MLTLVLYINQIHNTMNYEDLSPRLQLATIMSDLHKDAYGFRPRGTDFSSWTMEELEAEADRYSAICKENADAEAIYAAEQVEIFKATLQKTIDCGAGDRATALRWLFEGSELDAYDVEHFVWQLGFPYTDYGRSLKKELIGITAALRAA